MTNPSLPVELAGFKDLAGNYQAVLCDVWGVLHNGVHAYPAAVDALGRFRAGGGHVVLITNAPRPAAAVQRQLDRLGVDRKAYDAIVSSGDVARSFLSEQSNAKIFHLGPERDLGIYEGLPNPLVEEPVATLVCCTGLLDDDQETPDDYADQLERLASRGVPMLCVNPDKVVERGDRLVWCAGALAERFTALGGETIIVGKPYGRIYEAALQRLCEVAGCAVAKSAILAIGDGAATDVRGAFDQGIDTLFVTDGIHADEFGPGDTPDEALVHGFLTIAQLGAHHYISRLSWEPARS
jgi:HAD superfamily hydrolase (TIGR01459 family)